MRFVRRGVLKTLRPGTAAIAEMPDADKAVPRSEDRRRIGDALRRRITIMNEDRLIARVSFNQRNLYPEERRFRAGIPMLDGMGKQGAVFVPGKAQVRTIRLGLRKIKRGGGERDRHRIRRDIPADVRAG